MPHKRSACAHVSLRPGISRYSPQMRRRIESVGADTIDSFTANLRRGTVLRSNVLASITIVKRRDATFSRAAIVLLRRSETLRSPRLVGEWKKRKVLEKSIGQKECIQRVRVLQLRFMHHRRDELRDRYSRLLQLLVVCDEGHARLEQRQQCIGGAVDWKLELRFCVFRSRPERGDAPPRLGRQNLEPLRAQLVGATFVVHRFDLTCGRRDGAALHRRDGVVTAVDGGNEPEPKRQLAVL